MNRSRSRSQSYDSEISFTPPSPSPSPHSNGNSTGKKKKTSSRRNRFTRSNSQKSQFSLDNGEMSDASYPSGMVKPPAWNQPAYNPNPDSGHHRRQAKSSQLSSNSAHSRGNSNGSREEFEFDQTYNTRFPHQQQMQQNLQNMVKQQHSQQRQIQTRNQNQNTSYTSPENSAMPNKKKGIRRLLPVKKRNRKRTKSDESLSSRNSSRTFGVFRRNGNKKNNNSSIDSDMDYQSDTNYNYSNTKHNKNRRAKGGPPQTLSFGHRSGDGYESNDSNDFFDFDPSQSHNPNESERDTSLVSYDAPVAGKSDSERSGFFRTRFRSKASRQAMSEEIDRPSMSQNDHLQIEIDPYGSSDGYSFSHENDSYSEDEEEFSLNMSARSACNLGLPPGEAVDYSLLNKHKKDLASQNLQVIESMARKKGPNHADEAFQIFPNHSYPDTKMTRKQLRKHMNARSVYYHDLRMPKLQSNSTKELGKLRFEVLQCFGLPTTSLIKEVSAYAVAVMGSAAFQTDIIPNVANPIWLSKMRRACLFPVESMYSQLSIGIFDLEAAYAHPDTVVGHDGQLGWSLPDERTGFGNSMFDRRGSSAASGDFSASMRFPLGGARPSSFKHLGGDDDDDDQPGRLPSENRQPAEFSTKAEDFIGHVVVDICRLRPGSTYDVTLPLRRSNHVFTREPQGSVRIRLHLEWISERAAVMSYLPKSLGGTVSLQKQPNTRYTVSCVDDRAARNVAHAVHGIHMPGKFDMTLLKSTIREIHWTRIHLLRYCKNREIYHLTYWVYPSISGFVFLAWMHAVYFNTVRYVPGHVVVFFLLHLMKNYAYYAMDSPLQNGFLVPSLEELYLALLRGTKKRKQACIEPLTVEREADPMALTASDHQRIDRRGSNSSNMDELYDENGNLVHVTRFPLSEIADAMKKSLKVRPHRKGLTVFKHTFQGDDAVDFLLAKGFAMTRPEAVSVGRRLERENKLLQHINKDCMFEDSNLIYYFLDNSDTDRYLSQTAHVPRGARLLEFLGFYSRKSSTNRKNTSGVSTGGADILESREHIEFPFATGVDHPRFTVKESLVIRSAEEKSRLKRDNEALAIVEAADFGIVLSLSSQNLFPNQNRRASRNSGYSSDPGMNRRELISETHGNGSLDGDSNPRQGRRGSMLGSVIATGATVVATGATAVAAGATAAVTAGATAVAAGATSVIDGMNRGRTSIDSSSGGTFFEVASSQRDVYRKLKDQNSASVNKVLELQRKADEYDPYQYDSDNDVKTIQKKKRKKYIISEKHLRKPISQEIGNVNTTAAVDMSLAKSLEKTKKHVSAFFYHMFDDQAYKIDKSVFPVRMERNRDTQDKKKKKKKGLFNRRMTDEEREEEEERKKRLQMTPYEKQQEEMDKTLLINQYSHDNPWINRIAVILQPLLEMTQTFVFFFRALFNLLTWQDPVLCFWLCFTGPPLAFVLYVCPYRMIFFILGVYCIGPQNYILRIYRESKEGYEPPDYNLIVKKKKIEKTDNIRELQFFSSEAPGNQQIRFRNIDPTQVKQIVVPSNVMMYGSRFYDWPPEPKYSRVYASDAPSNLLVPGYAEDSNGKGYDSDSTYVFDQAARKKDEEEREKLIQKKKRKMAKGMGRKITDGIKKTTQRSFGVVETAGEQVYEATAGVTVGAVMGTAQITKSVVKETGRQAVSAAKGTGNLLRLRKKRDKKYKNYSDDGYKNYSDDDEDDDDEGYY